MKKFYATLAALTVTGGLTATAASASAGWICQELDSHPNTAGVTNIITELISQGYTPDNGGPELFVSTVVNQCPEYITVVKKAADQLS